MIRQLPRKNGLSTYDTVGGISLNFGQPLSFTYKPQTKKLPYFDPIPLIFFLGSTGKHLFGLNIHFIPLDIREEIINTILRIRIKIGANENELKNIMDTNPNITQVDINETLFGSDKNLKNLITSNGVDWAVLTQNSPNRFLRTMKVALRMYKKTGISSPKKIEYLEDDKMNKVLLESRPRILGLTQSDIEAAGKIAEENGNWNAYLTKRAR